MDSSTTVGILSDSHGDIDPYFLSHLSSYDEIWHAGDIGNEKLIDRLKQIKPLRAVYGNIDGRDIRHRCGEELLFDFQGIKVYMVHIGGYPPKYFGTIKNKIKEYKPQLFICGHSHILKIMYDNENNLLHINPGAVGRVGWHKIRTMVALTFKNGMIVKYNIVEKKR